MITVTKPAIRFPVDREGSRTDAVIPMSWMRLKTSEDIQDAYEAEKRMGAGMWIFWEQFKKQLDAANTGV